MTIGVGTAWADTPVVIDLMRSTALTIDLSDITFSGGTPTSSGYQVAAGQTMTIHNPQQVYYRGITIHFAAGQNGGSATVGSPYGYTLDGNNGKITNLNWVNPTTITWQPTQNALIESIELDAGSFIKLEFVGNGATEGSVASQYRKVGSTITLPACGYVRNNANFVCWAQDAQGNGRWDAGASYTVAWWPTVFYAKWSTSSSSPTQVFLNTGGYGLWGSDDAAFVVGSWDADWGNYTTTSMTLLPGYCYVYSAMLPAGTEHVQFFRVDPSNSNTVWNKTAQLNAEDVMYTITSMGSGSTDAAGYWGGLAKPNVTIRFDANGGTGSMAEQQVQCGNTLTLNPCTFTKAGYEFAGWNLKSDGSGTAYANGATVPDLSNNYTLYAQWSKTDRWYVKGSWDGWTLHEIVAGEVALSLSASKTYEYGLVHKNGSSETYYRNGGTMTSDNCTGWTFGTDGSGNCGITTTVAGSYLFVVTTGSSPVVTVVYPDRRYTITYDGNGGTGAMTPQSGLTYGSQVALTSNAFVNGDKSFVGWNTAADGSGTSYANEEQVTVSADLTLYAMWSGGLFGLSNPMLTTAGSGGPEQLTTIPYVHVEKIMGESDIYQLWTGKGNNAPEKKATNYTGGAKYYSRTIYRMEKEQADYVAGGYIGYSVRVDNGYELNLTRLVASLASSDDLHWKVCIESTTGTVLYETSSFGVRNYNASTRANDRTSADLSSEAALQHMKGTFYVKAYFYNDEGTSKYFCFPELLLNGEVAAAQTTGYCISVWDAKDAEDNVIRYFVQKEAEHDEYVLAFTMPDFSGSTYPKCWVGKDASYYDSSLGNNNAKSANVEMRTLPLKPNRTNKVGLAPGATGTLHIYDNSNQDNLYLEFTPDGYGLKWGHDQQDDWTSLAFHETATATVWQTPIIELDDAKKADDYLYYVGLKTATDYVHTTGEVSGGGGQSETKKVNTLEARNGSTPLAAAYLTGRGVFRIDLSSTSKNWDCHFVPYYHITYDKNAAEATGHMNWSPEISCEGAAAERTIHAPECDYARYGYTFAGWNTQADGSGTAYAKGADIVMSANMTLYAQWAPVETHITLDANFHGTDGYVCHRYGQHAECGLLNVVPAAGYEIEGYYTERVGGTRVSVTDGLENNVVINGVRWTSDNPEWVQWMYPVEEVTLYAHYTTTAVCKTFGHNRNINIDKLNTLCGGANIYNNGLAMDNGYAVMSTGDYITISDANGIGSVTLNLQAASGTALLYAKYSADGQNWTNTELVTIGSSAADYTLAVPNGTYYIQLQRAGTTDIRFVSMCVLEGNSSYAAPVIRWTKEPKVGVAGTTQEIAASASMPAGAAGTATISGYESLDGTVASISQSGATYTLHRDAAGSVTIYAKAAVDYGGDTHTFILMSDPFSVYGADGACRDLTMMWKNANLYDGATKAGEYNYIYRPADYFGQYFTLRFEQGLGVSATDYNRAQETEGSALNTGKFVGNAFLFTIRPAAAGEDNRRMSQVRFYGKQEAGDLEYTIDGEHWYTYNDGTEASSGVTVHMADAQGVEITKKPQSGKAVEGQDAWHTIVLPAGSRVFGMRNAGSQSGATHKGLWIRNMCITVCGFTDVECAAPMVQPTTPLYEEQTDEETFITMSVSDAGAGVSYEWYRTNYQGSPILTLPTIPVENLTAIDPAVTSCPENTYMLPMQYVDRRGTMYFICYARSSCGATKHSAVFTRVVQPANPTVRYTLEPSAPNGVALSILGTEVAADHHIQAVQSGMFYKMTDATPNNNGAVGGMTAKIPIKNTERNKYWDFVAFDYTIEPGYQMTVDQICLEVQPVSYNSYLFHAELFDAAGHRISGSLSHPEPGIGSMIVFQYDNTIALEGQVTLHLSAWDPVGHKDAAFRLGTKVSIYGDVAPLPNPQLTWTVAPHNGTEGDTPYQIQAQATNTTREIVYSSSNEDIVTVDADGTLRYLNAGRVEISATVEGDGVSSNGSHTISRTIVVDAAVTVGDCTSPHVVVTSQVDGEDLHLDTSGTTYNVKFCKNGAEFAAWPGLRAEDNTTIGANEVRVIQWFLQDEQVAIAEGHDVTRLDLPKAKIEAGLYRALVTVYDVVDQRKTQVSSEQRVQVRLVEAPKKPSITGLTTVEQGQELVLTASSEGATSYQWYKTVPGGGVTAIDGATAPQYIWRPTPADPTGNYAFSCVASSANSVPGSDHCSESPRSDALSVALHAASGCDWHWYISEADAKANYLEVCDHASITAGGVRYTYSEPLSSEQAAVIGDQYVTLNYATGQMTQPQITFPALPGTSGTSYFYAYPNWGTATIIGKRIDMVTHEEESIGEIGVLNGGWTLLSKEYDGGENGYYYTMTVQEPTYPIQAALCASNACRPLVDGLDIPVLEVVNNNNCGSVTLRVTYHTEGSTIHWYGSDTPGTPINDATWAGRETVDVDRSGSYWVVTEKDGQQTCSRLVEVSVRALPRVTSADLPDMEGEIGRTYTITAEYADADTYQWYSCDDRDHTNSMMVAGGTGHSLTLTLSAAYSGELFYYCVGKNSCGVALTNTFRVLVVQPTLQSCSEDGSFDEQYIDLSDSEARWNKTSKCFEVTSAHPINITAQEGYVITVVSYTENKAAHVDNYSPNDGVHAISITSDAGTRNISDLCVTVERECLDAQLIYENELDLSYSHTRRWDEDKAYPTLSNKHGLNVRYMSSNTMVATIDENGIITKRSAGTTDITAYAEEQMIAGARYCETSARYRLVIMEPLSGTHTPLLEEYLDGEVKKLRIWNGTSGTAYAGEVNVEWYMEGEIVKYADHTTTMRPKVAGLYLALVTYNGYSVWTNSVTVLGMGGIPVVEKLSPFHYYRKGCEYTAGTDYPTRHIFRVSPRGTGVKDGLTVAPWVATAHKYVSEDRDVAEESVRQWVKADPADQNLVLLDLKTLASRMKQSGFLQVGDSMVITITPRDMDDEFTADYAASITVYVVDRDRRSLAYIVSGGERSDVVLAGSFLQGYNTYDLKQQTAKTSWTNDEVPLYTHLKTDFDVTPVNGYAYDDLSGKNIYMYEPFDLILLTDYPKTDATVKDVKNASAPYVNALAALVDFRPMLSLKAHMAKATLMAWQAKGFHALPYTPSASATSMNVLCYSHEMFQQMPAANQPTSVDPVLEMLSGPGYDNGKGLQGFRMSDMQGFLNIATICSDGEESSSSGKTITEPLVACCERQNNINARLVVLSINAHATSMINENGQYAIDAILKYLLYDDPAKVSDCGYEFEDATGDHKWETPANWGPYYNTVPAKGANVRIRANCVLSSRTPEVGLVTIEPGKQMSVAPQGVLNVLGGVRQGYKSEHTYITSPSMLYLQSASTGNATLIHDDPEGRTMATVEMWSPAYGTSNGKGSVSGATWQWMTTPFSDVSDAQGNYYGAWMYRYDNSSHSWNTQVVTGSAMAPFDGYCVTYSSYGHVYQMQGTMVPTSNTEITLYNGLNLVGNSWTAPIDITKLQTSDFENAVATVVMFNTGLDEYGEGAEGTTAGTYISVPVETASEMAEAYRVIPSMQAFEVKATADGSLTLDYERVVRNSAAVNQPMHAPSRTAAQQAGIDTRLRIWACGQRYRDFVYLFRNPSTTNGFDNGWDGEKVYSDNYDIPVLYVENSDGDWQVSTQPTLVGTRFGFYRGEDAATTIRFEYDGDETLWLYDSVTDEYTLVDSAGTYTFVSTTYDLERRFSLTDYNPKAPATPTDVGDASAESADVVKFVKDETIYIRVGGRLYDAMGKRVE